MNNSFYEFDAYRIPNNIDSSQVIFISDGLLHDINLKNYLFIDVPLNTKNISIIDVNQEEKNCLYAQITIWMKTLQQNYLCQI